MVGSIRPRCQSPCQENKDVKEKEASRSSAEIEMEISRKGDKTVMTQSAPDVIAQRTTFKHGHIASSTETRSVQAGARFQQ